MISSAATAQPLLPAPIALEWLAPSPNNFRERLRAALLLSNPSERVERLVHLAQYRLGFVETIQLDNALGRSTAGVEGILPRVRLALLAASTIDHLLPAIRVAGLRRRLGIDLYKGGFGQYRQELLDPDSPLYEVGPEGILISLTAQQTVARTPPGATAD